MPTSPSGKSKEFFYLKKGAPLQDRNLHEPILAAGDEKRAREIGLAVARRAGLTPAQLVALGLKENGP